MQRRTNRTKWLIAVPFAVVVAVVLPAAVTGAWLWFRGDLAAIAYVVTSAGMWLVATAFVDVERAYGSPDRANRLIPAGLILSVPLSVLDRTWGLAGLLPAAVSIVAGVMALIAVVLGIAARAALRDSYAPRRVSSDDAKLVRQGPYRWVRHPMYLATLLWSAAYPLLVRSILGAVTALAFVIPAVIARIRQEEEELAVVFGDEYVRYRAHTWRLVPRIW